MTSDWFGAAERGDTETLARLLEQGIEVDTTDEYRRTALMFAVWGRHLETVQWLLSRGADPNGGLINHTAMTYGALRARGWQIRAGRCYETLEPDARFLDLLMAAGGRIGLREAILLGDVGMAQRIRSARHLPDAGRPCRPGRDGRTFARSRSRHRRH